MGFKLVQNPTFTAPVHLTVPGQPAPSRIEVEFRYRMPPALIDLIALEKPLASFRARAARWLHIWCRRALRRPFPSVRGILQEIVVGWDGVNDAQDFPLPYSPALLETLFEGYPAAANELLYAYLAARAEANRKN